jgi:hypothetical protein
VGLGEEWYGELVVRNLSKGDSVWRVKEAVEGMEVTPKEGRLAADQLEHVKLRFQSVKPCKLATELEIQQRGGKSMFVPFTIEVV